MTDTAPGDIAGLLERLGRVATPEVDRESHSVDLAALTGHDRVLPGSRGGMTGVVLTVATSRLVERLRTDHPVLPAAPGMTGRQCTVHPPGAVVIELEALESGPWAGALTTSRSPLMDELLALVESTRDGGGMTYLLPGADPAGTTRSTDAIRRAADVLVIADTSHPDTEGSPPTRLLRALMEHVQEGSQD